MKKAILLFMCILVVLLCSPIAFAHPGRTDSTGGHNNRSTGEYHYHHGYSAHDHYDMDGDGIVDCPFDFADKTDHSTSSSSSLPRSYSSPPDFDALLPSSENISKSTDSSTSQQSPNTIESNEEAAILPVWFFSPLFIIILILLIIIKKQKNSSCALQQEIDNLQSALSQVNAKWEEKVKQQYDIQQKVFDLQCLEIKESYTLQVEKMNQYIDQSKKDTEYLSSELKKALHTNAKQPLTHDIPPDVASDYGIPSGVYYLNGNIVRGAVSPQKPFGEFTVYVSSRSSVYHSEYFCSSGYTFEPAHIFSVIGTKRPCKKCGTCYGDKIPAWYQRLTKIANP